MNIVYPFFLKNDPEGACNKLTKDATEEWEKVNFYNDIYNIPFLALSILNSIILII